MCCLACLRSAVNYPRVIFLPSFFLSLLPPHLLASPMLLLFWIQRDLLIRDHQGLKLPHSHPELCSPKIDNLLWNNLKALLEGLVFQDYGNLIIQVYVVIYKMGHVMPEFAFYFFAIQEIKLICCFQFQVTVCKTVV